jgi:hypothetical protein
VRLDLSNSGQAGDWVEVRDVGSVADQGVRDQIITDLEGFARDPQRQTLQDVLDTVGVTNSSLSMRHPTSRTDDIRDHLGRAQVGHLSDGQYGALLDTVKRLAPRLLSEMRAQAAEAAKVARATMRGLATQPEIERELLIKAVGFEREADRAGRAASIVKAVLAARQRRGTVGEMLLEQSRRAASTARQSGPAAVRGKVAAAVGGDLPAPDMLFKADGSARRATETDGLRGRAAEYRRLAAMLGMAPSDVATLVQAADQAERQAAAGE